jgi:uncharacterized protein (TIGR02118 family)
MIRVSVMYPNKQGSYFDIAYYCTKHIPMVRELLGPALLHVDVEEGIGGATPDLPAAFLAMGHLSFGSVAAFLKAFAPHAAQIRGDVPNYTNSQPSIQISNVKI